MAFVSDVKCGKCDRRYSGLRARCPYCGARRGKAGKHANKGGNTTGKLIVGLILILLLIAAVVFLILTGGENFGKKDGAKTPDKPAEETQQNGGSIMGNDEDVTTVDGNEYVPAEQPEEPGGEGEGTQTPEGEDGEMAAPDELTYPWTGTVQASSVRVRSGAGTSYSEVNYATSGQEVTVTGDLKGETITDGGESSDVWYKIEYTTNGVKVEGYLNSLFVAPKS
ncbi:MAG: SH3 domain-containing protein [Oscillospiraceae bacterium]|nr:SH3 domain-containing protein [Oscillospiraceae bacterium]